MAQALSAVYLHLVFSTKKRVAYLTDDKIHAEMCAYLGGVSNKLGVALLLIGGTEDHIHALCRWGRSITMADWAKEMKRTSSIWVKKRHPNCMILPGNPAMVFFRLAYRILNR
jgi:putative transposase